MAEKSTQLVARPVARSSLSAIKKMAMRSATVHGSVSLAWGLPSFPTPGHIRDAVSRALKSDHDIGKYTLPNGLPGLRELAAEHYCRRHGVVADPDRNLFVTAGNMQGLHSLFRTLLEPGDEVILTDPGFASHIQQINLCDGQPVFWPLLQPDDTEAHWRLDADALPGLISDKTKAVVLVSPSNPTGAIFNRAELVRLAEVIEKHNLLLLVDDPYSAFTYDSHERYFCLASLPELSERLAYLFTFSKCYAMSGWRLGYMVLPEWLNRQVLKVHDATMICAPRISQVAGIAALSGPQDHLAEFEQLLGKRRQLICERLDRLAHLFSYCKPDGAYYVFPRIVADHQDSWEFSLRLLEDAGVTVTPGSAFGPAGEHHVRMAYCVDEDTINIAFDRLEKHFPAC